MGMAKFVYFSLKAIFCLVHYFMGHPLLGSLEFLAIKNKGNYKINGDKIEGGMYLEVIY